MGDRYIVISIVVAVCCVIIFMEIRNRLKLKAKVRNQWGEAPYQIRFDKEKSLKTAWQTEKTFLNGTLKLMILLGTIWIYLTFLKQSMLLIPA